MIASTSCWRMESIWSNFYFSPFVRKYWNRLPALSWYLAYFLSRYELSENEATSDIGSQCGEKFVGSHDVIVFVPPLPKPLISRCQYALGTWGIESRLLWEFEQVPESSDQMKTTSQFRLESLGEIPVKILKFGTIMLVVSKMIWCPRSTWTTKAPSLFLNTYSRRKTVHKLPFIARNYSF